MKSAVLRHPVFCFKQLTEGEAKVYQIIMTAEYDEDEWYAAGLFAKQLKDSLYELVPEVPLNYYMGPSNVRLSAVFSGENTEPQLRWTVLHELIRNFFELKEGGETI